MLTKYDRNADSSKIIEDPRDICNVIEGEELPEELEVDIEEPGVLSIALNKKKTTFNMRS